jgi:cation transport ATPase
VNGDLELAPDDRIRARNPGMMTLIGVAITAAYIYSLATVLGLPGNDFDTSTLARLMALLGEEALAKLHAQEAALLKKLAEVRQSMKKAPATSSPRELAGAFS